MRLGGNRGVGQRNVLRWTVGGRPLAVPGGRLLSTSLVNVLLTDDGRIFVGMVPADRLQAAAGTA